MRAVLVVLWLALISVLVAGQETSEELCIITYTVSPDFSQVEVRADLLVSSVEMAEIAQQVDADDDGFIMEQEVTDFEEASRHAEYDPSSLGAKKLVLDGFHAFTVRIHTELRGFEGPIDDADGRLVTEVRLHAFPVREAEYHVLEGGLYAEGEHEAFVVEEFVVLRAPEGWLVDRVNDTDFGQRIVELPAFGTANYFQVGFAPELEPAPEPSRSEDSLLGQTSAPAALWVALCAMAAAFHRRRRGG